MGPVAGLDKVPQVDSEYGMAGHVYSPNGAVATYVFCLIMKATGLSIYIKLVSICPISIQQLRRSCVLKLALAMQWTMLIMS